MPLKLCSCEPNELTPEFEIETEPNMLVRTMSSAQAAIGNANASNARTTTRLMLIPSQIFLLFSILCYNPDFRPRYRSPVVNRAFVVPQRQKLDPCSISTT